MMNKDLPKVYPGKVEENLNNVQEVFYGASKEERSNDDLSIESKINRIFNSPNYIYKKEVIITTHNQNLKKTIIGKTSNNLLTIDNELININNIDDIKEA